MSTTIINGSAGYDAQRHIFEGTVAEQKKQIAQASGVEAGEKTLFELTVEASLSLHRLVKAATIGTPTEDKSEKPAKRAAAKKTTAKKSIAAKARSSQPEKNTKDIESLVAGAKSTEALADVYHEHAGNLTQEDLELFSARKKELGG